MTWSQIKAWLEPYRKDLVGVVVESTYNWYWLLDGLMDAGYPSCLGFRAACRLPCPAALVHQRVGGAGKDMGSIAAFVGHPSQVSTWRYIHFMPKEKRATAESKPFEF